jgi:plastocyanin
MVGPFLAAAVRSTLRASVLACQHALACGASGHRLPTFATGFSKVRTREVLVATDIVYIARQLMGLTVVPQKFRLLDPPIPPDSVIGANIDALCPSNLTTTPVTHTVVVGPNGTFSFSPENLTIHVGEAVEWTWASGGHNVVSGTNCTADAQFCSPNGGNCALAPLSPKDTTYSRTFTTAGAFPYFCSAHCDFGMVGMITVQ